MRALSRRRWDVLQAALLALLVVLVLAFELRLGSGQSLKTPLAYHGDARFTAAVVKAASEGAFPLFRSKENPRLGAPFVANWNDRPGMEDPLFWGVGLLARCVGVFRAINVSFIGAAVFAALTLYALGRRLRLRSAYCFAAGALFGLSPYLFGRSVHHFNLVHFWHLPACLWVVFQTSSRRGLGRGARATGFSLLTAAVTGVMNVYYLNYFLQLMGLALLTQAWRRAALRRMVPAVTVMAVALLSFAAVNLDTVGEGLRRGPNPTATERGAKDSDHYALKPLALFIPGSEHRWASFARLGQAYVEQSVVSGEFPFSYLGVLGSLAFLWMMGHTLKSVALGTIEGPSRWGLLAVWLLFYSVPGGFNALLTLGGLRVFRANNRVSILLMALALLFAARRLNSWNRRVSPQLAWALSLGVLTWGLWEQTPRRPRPEELTRLGQIVQSDRHLVAGAEARLPKGARVFQLPAMDFPEVPPTYGVQDYELFRPYFFAKDLRFAYGNIKGRPEATWQFLLASKAPLELVQALKSAGFSGIYVNKGGFPPQEARALLAGLAAAGAGPALESELGDSVFVFLPR